MLGLFSDVVEYLIPNCVSQSSNASDRLVTSYYYAPYGPYSTVKRHKAMLRSVCPFIRPSVRLSVSPVS